MSLSVGVLLDDPRCPALSLALVLGLRPALSLALVVGRSLVVVFAFDELKLRSSPFEVLDSCFFVDILSFLFVYL